MDKIFLRELEIEAVIGIWAWERRIRQRVSISLEMAADIRAAYRAAVKRCHPDRVANEPESVQRMAHTWFVRLCEARDQLLAGAR